MAGLLYHVAAGQNKPAASYSPNPLEDSVKKYEAKGEYPKCLVFAGKWVDKTKKKPGKDSLDFAAALNVRGNMLRKSKSLKEAEADLVHAVAIRKRVLREVHPDLANSYSILGALYDNIGNLPKADTVYSEALEIRRKALGEDHPDVENTLYSLGIVNLNLGNLDKAESYHLKALEIRKKTLGEDHPKVGDSYIYLGWVNGQLARFDKSESFLVRALEIKKKANGEENQDLGPIYANLGILKSMQGDFAKAEFYIQKALEIQKKFLGEDHPRVAALYNNLGINCKELGDFARSESFLYKALEIWKKALGEEHPDVATSYQNLGDVLYDLGDFATSETYYVKALEIRKKTLSDQHPDLADSFNNLGIVNMNNSDYSKAISYHSKALEIRKRSLGEEHPSVAESIHNLGAVHYLLGNFSKTESCYSKAFEIMENTFDKGNPKLAVSFYDLGCIHHKTGHYNKAESFFKMAREIQRKALGEESPLMVNLWYGFGNLYFDKKEFAKAASHYQKGQRLHQRLIGRYFPVFSEHEREAYLKKDEDEHKVAVAFLIAAGQTMPELRGELYDHQLFFKGLLLNTSARWKQRIKTSGDLKLIRRYDEWEILQHKISNLFTSTDSSERAGLDSLVHKAEKLEKELAQRSENFARSEERKARSWQEVQQRLKPGEAAIEMVRIQKYGIARVVTDTSDQKKPTYLEKGLTDTIQYAALVLTKTGVQPELVLLQNGNALEGKWFNLYRNSIDMRIKDELSYRQFWEPIARKLKGIKKVWFSADGVYHKINPGTLKNPANGKYVFEEMELSLLGSTKDLLKNNPDESENRLACLVGNPDFQTGRIATAGQSRSVPEISYYLQPIPGMEISELPGTQIEVDSIAALLQKKGWEVQEYAGSNASEEKIKDIYKPSVLLLSTHGFFQPDSTPGTNPLIHSGLLLSGSARTLREGKSRNEADDGILTAYEAMNLNLDNTELVVLSACETGLGEIKNGEGVYGLQRAFQVAGARHMIMSLWKVDDTVTQQLMVRFFKHWLNGKSKQAAFNQAQKEIQARHREPYYWGGFVMMGK
jgi:CHAT domain-containing protein/tetratricopeptide (TPR) repeat protein